METMSRITRIEGWEWEKRDYGVFPVHHFWTTKDPSGNSWIVKFTGSFYSYREWVFSRLASRLGLNARNVRLAMVSHHDLLKTSQEDAEPFQLLLEPINTYDDEPCNPGCPYPEWKKHLTEDIDFCTSARSAPYNAVDYILKDFMADIFGANEPSEVLFGADHNLYIIDNEQMFSTEPSGRISAPWLFDRHGAFSESGHKLLLSLCRKIASLPDVDLLHISKCPDEYKVDMPWDILPILHQGKRLAQSILRHGPVYYKHRSS